jgi:uncharacterized glyoxalase superfamily protein PhnB
MKILWCWRCKTDIPMLDNKEWESVWGVFEAAEGKHQDRRPAALAEYERLTGFKETNFNAIFHHRVSCHGPPCPRCGKVLRTPVAYKCFECGLHIHEPTDHQFLKTTVTLPVNDIYDTIAWLEKALGFQTRYIHGSGKRGEAEDFANYAIAGRDGVEVHFILDEGGPVWTRASTGRLGLTVRDVEAVYADVISRGIAVARKLQKENWPARGFNLQDPSGNEIHIEQPISNH